MVSDGFDADNFEDRLEPVTLGLFLAKIWLQICGESGDAQISEFGWLQSTDGSESLALKMIRLPHMMARS